MLAQQDLNQISQRGISEEKVMFQLQQFKKGFPYLKIEAAASIGNGILTLNENEQQLAIDLWAEYKNHGHKVVKFVPASGAASRMFKDLFNFLANSNNKPTTEFEHIFFNKISLFAFHKALDEMCKKNKKKNIEDLEKEGRYKEIVSNLLEKSGLNYGQLPKGLLLFHNYNYGARTPLEEHLVEAALYAASSGKANIHFTVSNEHLPHFHTKVAECISKYEEKYGIRFNISFSVQKQSTDTIAVNPDNTPFRNEDGTLLFRPGGHGALIENLNDIDADVVFIKNIDNVVPDRLKSSTILYKNILAGVLIENQKKAFGYLKLLDSGIYNHNDLENIIHFVQRKLCCRRKDLKDLEDADLVSYLRSKLNRPMRVCGVVKNVGEPGGGPFLAYNSDGTISPQILESSQIDKTNPEYMKMFTNGTHFNPVDLVCAVRDYKGNHFNLPAYIDFNTGFISNKSKNGQDLKALELPGLWNGAMSDWNTIFVEVPLNTFNPVKTVNDLLRSQHQQV